LSFFLSCFPFFFLSFFLFFFCCSSSLSFSPWLGVFLSPHSDTFTTSHNVDMMHRDASILHHIWFLHWSLPHTHTRTHTHTHTHTRMHTQARHLKPHADTHTLRIPSPLCYISSCVYFLTSYLTALLFLTSHCLVPTQTQKHETSENCTERAERASLNMPH